MKYIDIILILRALYIGASFEDTEHDVRELFSEMNPTYMK